MNTSPGTRSNAFGSDTIGARQLLNKVPEVTMYFWIIKILCTTVGETVSDFLNVNLGFGLTGTSIVMGIVLLVLLVVQFQAKRYIPSIYWLTVVAISVFGTLVTDTMTDGLGVPLEVSTIAFSIALGLTFIAWYSSEKTLSIHSIFTARREAFYWLAILFTFALGTATGDLMAESLGLGYWLTGVIVCVVIASVTIAWRLGLDPIVAFWTAYSMTRPLGASIGDYLSQDPTYGGLGLGATVTSMIFLGAILLTVIFLSITKRDVSVGQTTIESTERRPPAFLHAAGVVGVLVVLGGAGYVWRHAQLQAQAQTASSLSSPLGDVSDITTIENDMVRLVNAGDLVGSKTRADDLEKTWDNDQARLKAINSTKWTEVDDTIDAVLSAQRAPTQDPAACKTTLEASLAALGNGSNAPTGSLAANTAVPLAASPLPNMARPTMSSNSAAPTPIPSQPTSAAPSAATAASGAPTAALTSPLGDVSDITTIENDLLRMVNVGNLAGAKTRANDLEKTWDNDQPRLQAVNATKWTEVDGTIDTVLSQLRAAHPDSAASTSALEASLVALK